MPQTKEQCADAIAEIAKIQSKIDIRQTALDESIATLTQNTEEQVAPLRLEAQALEAAVQSFCETRRSDLCKGKAKSHKFTTGVVGWKAGGVVVNVEEGKEAEIIAALKLRKQGAALKTTTRINKNAVKNFTAELLSKIPGLSKSVNPETFYIKPHVITVDREAEVQSEAA